MENSTNTSEGMNSDISEVKPSLQATLDSGKPSSAFVNPGSPVKKETPDSCEEVADEGKNSVFADRSNRVQVKIGSSLDEINCPYSKYDKDEPELKGPITSYPQYQEYWQEYHDKYDSYLSLKKILEGYRDEFKKIAVECEDAKARGDIDRYNEIREQTLESYKAIFEKRKKIFLVLQAELSSIKQRIKDAIDEQKRRKRLKIIADRDSCEEVADGGKDSVFADRDNRDQQKRESSSDENNCSYSKYVKDEPELKGPLTSYPQYEEYVLHKELSSIKEVIDERRNRLEAGNLTPEDSYKDPNNQAGNRADIQGSSDVGFQKGNKQALPQTGQRSSDEIPLGNPSYPLQKSDKHGESIRYNRKHSGRDFHAHELSSIQKDKSHGDARNEKILATEKKIPRNFRDGSNGSKLSVSKDSSYRKQGEMVGKLKEGRQDTLSQLGASPKDNNRTDLDKSPGVDRRGISLQREFSDLNLGELRESAPEETRVAKQFERKGSFKHTNTSDSEDMISDITKGQTPNSCEEVADGGKDSVFSDRVNRDQQKRESSSDENSCSYTKYIQYQEYVQEFKDKYDSYLSLVKILDDYSDEFKKLAVDMDGYNEIRELIEETYRECNVRFEELSSMKQRIEDFVEKYKTV